MDRAAPAASQGQGRLSSARPPGLSASHSRTPATTLPPGVAAARNRAATPAAPPLCLRLLELGETPEDGWPAKLSDPATGWSLLRYTQRIDPASVKPTAEVLAMFSPASAGAVTEPPQGATPAVLSMRYGAGRVLYVATDEIWRWRYARGEALPERFWLPLIRLQGRESLARSSRPATLEISPRRPEVEQPVRLAVTLLDQSLLDSAPSSLTVRLKRVDEQGTSTLTLAPELGGARSGQRGAARSFATTWLPPEAGKYHIEVRCVHLQRCVGGRS